MDKVWTLSAICVGLALLAMMLAIRLKISIALVEIVVGSVAQLGIGAFFAGELEQLATDLESRTASAARAVRHATEGVSR
jgi:hypothetical protein